MEALAFSNRVLGPKAAERLKAKKVTQTLRSGHTPYRAIAEGDMIKVTLDGHLVGYVELLSTDAVKWEDLDRYDAERGGFLNISELGAALRRAGFRFKALTEYEFYCLQFTWRWSGW